MRDASRAPRGAERARNHAVSGSLVLLAMVGITALVAVTGGVPNVWAHLYYLPIIYVAVRYGMVHAAVMAVAAGLVVGPWMPSSLDTGQNQDTQSWLVRMVFFVGVALLTAWLARSQSRPVDAVMRDHLVARALRAGLRRGEVRVHFQPFIDLRTGAVAGFEALCRWDEGDGRLRPPDQFIPQAERTGVIKDIGSEVLRASVAQAGRWADAGHGGHLMSVNVSPVQLSDPRFVTELVRVARGYSIEEFRLCLEVTESAIIADPERARDTLSTARALGMRVAVDDFGTGQSSLAYLAEFPIDIVKIDRAFVAALGADAKSQALVRAMVAMARGLGATTIAEGIETREQLEVLAALGCDLGQGFYLGRPMPAEAVDWHPRPEVLIG